MRLSDLYSMFTLRRSGMVLLAFAAIAAALLIVTLAGPRAQRAAAFNAAARAGDWAQALSAAHAQTAHAPEDVSAWHQVTWAATELADGPDRTALGALATAHAYAPFPSPAEMTWRIEYAARYWAAMPEPLARAAVAQLGVMAQLPGTWDRRALWCKGFPDGALADAACASVPGISRP